MVSKQPKIIKILTKKGYTLKAGLKYGCDFRIYAKGVKVKRGKKRQEEHSFAVLDIVKNKEDIKLKDLVAKARVATTSKMQLFIAFNNSDKLLEIKWVK